MSTRLSLRRSILLLGAFSWLALPVSLCAGPGGGSSGGSHGGGHSGGGSHSGGTHSSGTHSGGAAHSSSSAHASSAERGPSSSARPHLQAASSGAASRTGTSGGLMSFAAAEESNHAHAAGAPDPNLTRLAGHGWSFLPSSGVTRPANQPRLQARPRIPTHAPNIPAILPLHHPHHRLPYATSYPYGAFGGCFFNGFTSVCGYNPFFYGGYGANYCFSSFGFWNCGYGGYGTGFYGLNSYGPGPGYGYDVNAYPADASSDSPNNSYRMDPSDAYIPQAGDNAGQNPSEAAPRTPPTELIFKNGSAYAVTAYWVSGGEIYYRPVTGGLDHVPVDQLDLAATVEANARNGVTFQLTDHEPEP